MYMINKFKISDQRFKLNSDQTIWLIGFQIFTFSILEEGHLPNTFNFIPNQTKFSCKKKKLVYFVQPIQDFQPHLYIMGRKRSYSFMYVRYCITPDLCRLPEDKVNDYAGFCFNALRGTCTEFYRKNTLCILNYYSEYLYIFLTKITLGIYCFNS